MGESGVLSKLDLVKGFHQVKVESSDRQKTAFLCPWGKWEYLRMPFGLRNAPATFQKLMDRVLTDCHEYSSVYIDDILIWSSNWKQHLEHLRGVFGQLEKEGLTCQVAKCEFGKSELEFLGHRIGHGRLSVPADRITALTNYKRPVSKKQLRAFLGYINFYRRFVPGIYEMTSILTPTTSKDLPTTVKWTTCMVEAFDMLCKRLCKNIELCIPTTDDKLVLETDASTTGVGAVLQVDRGEQGMLPVAFYSAQLRGAECNYAAQELEALALVKAIKHFSFYLYGRNFDVLTDHESLQSTCHYHIMLSFIELYISTRN